MRRMPVPLFTLMNKGELISDMDVNLFMQEADSKVVSEYGEYVCRLFLGDRNQLYMEVPSNNMYVPYIGEIRYFLYDFDNYKYDKIDKDFFVLKYYEFTKDEAKAAIKKKNEDFEWQHEIKRIMMRQEQELKQKQIDEAAKSNQAYESKYVPGATAKRLDDYDPNKKEYF